MCEVILESFITILAVSFLAVSFRALDFRWRGSLDLLDNLLDHIDEAFVDTQVHLEAP